MLKSRVAHCLLLAIAPICWAVPSWAEDGATQSAAVRREAFKLDPLAGLDDRQLQHPLVPAITLAMETLQRIDTQVTDYTCRFIRRERSRGTLKAYEYAFAKVRHRQDRNGEVAVPFSVYMRFLGPASIEGRELIYVEGRHNDEMIARNGGRGNLNNVTMWLDPRGERVLRDSKYPPTEFGIEKLTQTLIEAGRMALDVDQQRNECEVRNINGAKVNGRPVKVIQIRFPVRRENLDFHLGRIFIDEETKLPIRFAYYTWPQTAGGQPRLMAEYNYTELKLNVGLTDRDFDEKNPEYGFYIPQDDP
jgi:hypothetical protein